MKKIVYHSSWVLALAMGVVTIAISFPFYREIDAMVYRAQVSADAGKMADRLDETLANMERYGVTQGHAALIFHSPENDVALDYEALRDLRDRASGISTLDRLSVEYQTALDDMRGTLREITVDAWYYALIRQPSLWVAWVLTVLWCVMFFTSWSSDY